MPLPSDFATRYEAKRQALTDARTAIAVLEAEVRTYEEIAALLRGGRPPDCAPGPPTPPREARPRKHRRKSLQARSLREKPKAVIRALVALYPKTHNVVSLGEALAQAGHSTRADTLRSLVADYVKRGYIERVTPGVFRVTSAGARAAGTDLGK